MVTTNDFFFLLNIQDKLKVIIRVYNRETIHTTYSFSIVKREDICDCVIQTTEIQLIGSHTNCSTKGNFFIHNTFNFVTKWIYNKGTMSYYRENAHILHLPSQAKVPDLRVFKCNTANVYTESKTPPISLNINWMYLSTNLKMKIYISLKLTRTERSIGYLANPSDNILDIDSWFDDELQSSMIFIFSSCIIALIAFVFLLFLCYKHEKMRKILTFYMISSDMQHPAATDTSPCHRSDLYMYLLSTVCLTLLIYVILKILLRLYK